MSEEKYRTTKGPRKKQPGRKLLALLLNDAAGSPSQIGGLMQTGVLRLIRHCAEWRPVQEISKVPDKTRGIYALLKHDPKQGPKAFNLVYIGMSRKGVKGRLLIHRRSKSKRGLWTHFSVYSVWPNITDDEIAELEGLFRAIYRRDTTANSIAVQKGFKKLLNVRNNKFQWS